ncbi:MAG: hypothetical protein K8L99_06865 [Anaerolineae bacterium]|nr:hypothetical protein [Anaerolineae bacterium]
MQGLAWVFFVLLALVLLGSYLAIRREWMPPLMTALLSVVLSVILMILVSLGQQNGVLQAVVVGILVGGIFSGATLAVAWYFHTNELQQNQQ